jgi:hypothetical protein
VAPKQLSEFLNFVGYATIADLTTGGVHENSDLNVRHHDDGADHECCGPWGRMPQKLTAWPMLPHGQQHWLRALPLKTGARHES